MNDENFITIFHTQSVEEIPGLSEQLAELQKSTKVDVKAGDAPAVVGEFAGRVIEILISPEVQAIINIVEIGAVLWGIRKLIEKIGKKIYIGKYIAKLLLVTKSRNDLVEDGIDEMVFFEKAKIFGPMEIDTLSRKLYEQLPPAVESLTPYAFFMATVIPIGRDRARTYWYILRTDGLVIASWTTQTFIAKLPDFLKL